MLKKLTHYLKKIKNKKEEEEEEVSFTQASEQCKRIALFTFFKWTVQFLALFT